MKNALETLLNTVQLINACWQEQFMAKPYHPDAVLVWY